MRCDCDRVPVDCCDRLMPTCKVSTVFDADGTVSACACSDGHGCGRGLRHSCYGCRACECDVPAEPLPRSAQWPTGAGTLRGISAGRQVGEP